MTSLKRAHIPPSLLLFGAVLAGCSATYKVSRVATANDANVTQPGLYYRLPKTQVLVAIPIAKKTVTVGKYVGVWDNCVNVCNSNPAGACKVHAGVAESTFELGLPKVVTRALGDAQHTYRLDVEFSAFAAFNHLLKFNDQGVLTNATTQYENHAVEIAAATVKSLVDIAAAGADEAVASEEKCADFKRSQQEYSIYKKTRTDLDGRLDRLLYDSAARLTGPAVVEIVRYHEARIARLDGEHKHLLDARATKEQEKAMGALLTQFVPKQMTDYVSAGGGNTPVWWYTSQVDAAGLPPFDSMEPVPAGMEKMLPELQKISVSLKREAGDDATIDCETVSEPRCGSRDDSGFRYRLPASAILTIQQNAGDTSKILATSRLPIAQYGALVAMPAKVAGLKSKLNMELNEQLGSLRQAELGATPQAATAGSQFVDIAKGELERRKSEKDKARTAAENAEKDALTKQRDLLKLRNEIKDLEDSLADGNEAAAQ